MGKSQLIHNNEFHLISKAEIRKATGKLVGRGSDQGDRLIKLSLFFFRAIKKEISGWTSPFILSEKTVIIYQPIFLSEQRVLQCHPV